MSFFMIDRIVSWEKGKRIVALKTLSLCEEYLADHFPAFPVMPGVLMLEAMAQAAEWLLRLSDDISVHIFLLREVRAVRYGNFVRPGDLLRLQVELLKNEGARYTFKGKGVVGNVDAVTGRFTLVRKELKKLQPGLDGLLEKIELHFRERRLALMRCEGKLDSDS
jgi:3-hydroxyacyl-[acyl-carrier-protein] dehydratase